MEGEGVFKSYDRAFENFMKAAKLGDPRGQYMVAHIYQAGLIDPDDKVALRKSLSLVWSGHARGLEQAQSVKCRAAPKQRPRSAARFSSLAWH